MTGSASLKLPLFGYETANDDDIEDGVSPIFMEIPFSSICGSSYDDAECKRTGELPPEMITFPLSDALFSLEKARADVPAREGDVFVRQYLDPKLYQIVFFSTPSEPQNWIGFAALTYDEGIENREYQLEVRLEMLYVKKQYRRRCIGKVMSNEVARKITELRSFNLDIVRNADSASVVLSGEGVTRAGAKLLQAFILNFQGFFVLSNECDDTSDDIIELPVTWDTCDEY